MTYFLLWQEEQFEALVVRIPALAEGYEVILQKFHIIFTEGYGIKNLIAQKYKHMYTQKVKNGKSEKLINIYYQVMYLL